MNRNCPAYDGAVATRFHAVGRTLGTIKSPIGLIGLPMATTELMETPVVVLPRMDMSHCKKHVGNKFLSRTAD